MTTARYIRVESCGECNNRRWLHMDEVCAMGELAEGESMKPLAWEHKQKISLALKGRPHPHRGVPRTEEAKAKISVARKGKPNHRLGIHHNAETRAKISVSMKGKNIGKHHTKEAREKISEALKGNKYRWEGGRRKSANGYIRIFMPNHPYADIRKSVFEHRLMMEKHLGRILLPTEVVHHINGIVDDNGIENLMLFSSTGTHVHHHKILRRNK